MGRGLGEGVRPIERARTLTRRSVALSPRGERLSFAVKAHDGRWPVTPRPDAKCNSDGLFVFQQTQRALRRDGDDRFVITCDLGIDGAEDGLGAIDAETPPAPCGEQRMLHENG